MRVFIEGIPLPMECTFIWKACDTLKWDVMRISCIPLLRRLLNNSHEAKHVFITVAFKWIDSFDVNESAFRFFKRDTTIGQKFGRVYLKYLFCVFICRRPGAPNLKFWTHIVLIWSGLSKHGLVRRSAWQFDGITTWSIDERGETTAGRGQCAGIINGMADNDLVHSISNSIRLHHLQKITEKCFKKCVNKPGTSLGSSEQVHSTHPFGRDHRSTKFNALHFIPFDTEMHSDVYGSFYGFLEFNFTCLYATNTERTERRRWLLKILT